MPGKWYYVINNVERGPYSLTQLQDMVAKGVVQRMTMIRCGRDAPWIQAHNIGLLFARSQRGGSAARSPSHSPIAVPAEKWKIQIIIGTGIGACLLLVIILLLMLLINRNSQPQMAGGDIGNIGTGRGEHSGAGDGSASVQNPISGAEEAASSSDKSTTGPDASEDNSTESSGPESTTSSSPSPPSPDFGDKKSGNEDKPMEIYLHSQPTPVSSGGSKDEKKGNPGGGTNQTSIYSTRTRHTLNDVKKWGGSKESEDAVANGTRLAGPSSGR